jgi:hypothetical protein
MRIARGRRLDPPRPAEATRSLSRTAVAVACRGCSARRAAVGAPDRRRRRACGPAETRAGTRTHRRSHRREPTLARRPGDVVARRPCSSAGNGACGPRAAGRPTTHRCASARTPLASLAPPPRLARRRALRRALGCAGSAASRALACGNGGAGRRRRACVAAAQPESNARRHARSRTRHRYAIRLGGAIGRSGSLATLTAKLTPSARAIANQPAALVAQLTQPVAPLA